MFGGTSLLHSHPVHVLMDTHSSKNMWMSHDLLCKKGDRDDAFICFLMPVSDTVKFPNRPALPARRAPPGAEAGGFTVGPPAGDSEATAVAWDAYWGFDCVAQRGLCSAIYSHLHIVDSSWQALKMLPSVSTPNFLSYHGAAQNGSISMKQLCPMWSSALGGLHGEQSRSLLQLTCFCIAPVAAWGAASFLCCRRSIMMCCTALVSCLPGGAG